MKKQNILTIIILLITIIISSLLWKFIEIPYVYKEVINHNLKNYNYLNDYIRYLVFISFPIISFILLRVYKKKLSIFKFAEELKIYEIPQKNNFGNLIYINYILFIFLILEFLSINFPIFKLDLFHEGQKLSASFKSLNDDSLWSGSFIIIGIIHEILTTKFIWKIFNKESIGLMRYADLIYIFLCKLFIILIIYKISLISNLKNYYREIFFILSSLLLINLINYNNDRLDYDYILYRELPILFIIYSFLEIISRNKQNFYLFLIALISPFCFLWSIDRAITYNLIILLILIYFAVTNNIKKIFLFILFFIFSLIVIKVSLGNEFEYFITNTMLTIKEMGPAHANIHPLPFSSEKEATRATKVLLLILLNFVIAISIINKKKYPINLRLFLVFLSIISFISYSYALSRSDKIHFAESFGYPIIFISLFILYSFFIFLSEKNLFNLKYNFSFKAKFFFNIALISLFFFKSINFENIYTYKNRFDQYINLKDEFYLDEKTINFINYSNHHINEHSCIQMFSYDVAFLYLLKKINCTKYYFVWSVGSNHLQEDFIKNLTNVEIIIADSNDQNSTTSPKNTLLLIKDYINKNYKKILEIEDKIILEKIK